MSASTKVMVIEVDEGFHGADGVTPFVEVYPSWRAAYKAICDDETGGIGEYNPRTQYVDVEGTLLDLDGPVVKGAEYHVYDSPNHFYMLIGVEVK